MSGVRSAEILSGPAVRCFESLAFQSSKMAETSGRVQRDLAEDFEVGLSTPRHWIDKPRNALMESPPRDGV
ncbi:hypothetical protein GCM10011335_42080 [Aureimonas glaciei]|uniref:Uncharacterized protein n=1 Tax=Aureimonas glaciei TaxID=1776957 RepID=A0A917DGX0_9HYPH|nr:hypothetical protein GCM10011335_42080 [Aureimonas glaciei]